MAEISHIITGRPELAGILRRCFAAVGNALVAIAEADSRMRAARQLNAMSDEELAERGLRREDIVRHIFSDRFYI
ncbi:DUF1127 domain-containing protein [Leisingera methylohalidivorans]|uniref:DUF1127 domain-containing protein n=1 Tax=Leisingera methylohalidivorans DSM 14336 TaxID=999552 RepID=V9W125_9RHOB|nr:DUF1127 domain-containing protein [Leisingera methylohalidivorans]AHD03355.1 hypothetical protein METH_21260 [Leisingera methylohalidivorans DSM 14336]